MPKSPLGNLPLSEIPHNSRITSEYGSDNKNYYMVGFNPGYALQASELNEIQELFFLNQSLTARCHSLWSNAGKKIPFWSGLIPLNPFSISVSTPEIDDTGVATLSVTIADTWFLWSDYDSGLSFWIHLEDAVDGLQFDTGAGTGTEYIGFDMTKTTILCCATDQCSDTQDSTLRDNSQGGTENFFTCGASRLKVAFASAPTIVDAIDTTGTFYPILKITKTFSETGYAATVKFYDDQSVTATN
jgi:hypothetical protein